MPDLVVAACLDGVAAIRLHRQTPLLASTDMHADVPHDGPTAVGDILGASRYAHQDYNVPVSCSKKCANILA
jgi:hypothetical protein